MQRIKTIYYLTVLTIFTVVMFVVFAVTWMLTVLPDRNRRVVHALSRFWSKTIYRLGPGWKVKVEGTEHIRPKQAYIVVSNHQAMLDIPLLYVLPFNFKWVSKREVYKIPVFGWVLWMHGDVAIERGGTSSARKMMADCEAYLDRGVSVILFPEGTRTHSGRVNGFKEGAMMLAAQSGYPILPVVIDGTFDAFAKEGIASPHTFRVRVLAPVAPKEIAGTEPRALRDSLNRLMGGEHRAMAPERYN